MTNIDSPPRRRRFVVPVLGALAAVAAGAVLYGTVAPAGKAASDCPADSAKLAARLAPLAKGELAALQVASEPRRAEQFAFERDGRRQADACRFQGPRGAAQPVGDLVRALPGGDAGARSASGRQGRAGVRGGGGECRHRAAREAAAPSWTASASKSLARYADPSGDAFETLRKDGKALGLPVTLVIDKDGCEVAAVEGGAKWDSAEAQALVEALKGG